jgi:hypothetical protein
MKIPSMKIPHHRKKRGEWVELLFMAHATRRGLKVAKPHGDSAPFDVIVENDGRFFRVQVKSTMTKHHNCWRCTCFSWSYRQHRPVAKPYRTGQLDFLAAYIIPEHTWFIIPARELRSRGLVLPSKKRTGPHRYTKYREAWHLLGVPEGLRVTIHASAEIQLPVVGGQLSAPSS